MAEGSSPACAVCLDVVQDPRLLQCLHSMCKHCIDQLDLASSHKRQVICPVCRFETHLPLDGAAGLLKDATRSGEKSRECKTCQQDSVSQKAEFYCTACDIVFCRNHGVRHIVSSSGHTLGAISEQARSSLQPSSRLCSKHKCQLKYLCRKCNELVCGDCVALATGGHHKHEEFFPIEDVIKRLQQTIGEKADKLLSVHLSSAKDCLSAIDSISSKISSCAEKTRSEIRAAGKRAMDMVEVIVHEKMVEVDDLEQVHLKALDGQHDDLKRQVNSLTSAIDFGEKFVRDVSVSVETYELLTLLGRRVDILERSPVARTPASNACLAHFGTITDDELVIKVRQIVGDVRPCRASSDHSCVEGGNTVTCMKDLLVRFVVVVKDDKEQVMVKGDDDVCAKWLRLPQGTDQPPCVEVTDNNNGTYDISCRPTLTGDYLLQVTINGVALQEDVTIVCTELVFDTSECQDLNLISPDKCTVIHTGAEERWSSVLGSCGMKTGHHVWKVKQEMEMKNARLYGVIVGVAEKTDLSNTEKNFTMTYSWHGGTGDKISAGDWSCSMSEWEEDDVLQFSLDCDAHTLFVTNLCSGESATIESLPAVEFFPYFALYHKNDKLTLLT